jgi:histidine kinase
MIKAIRRHFALKILIAFFLVAILSGVILTAVMNISIGSTYEKHIGRLMTNEGLQQGGQSGNRGSTLYENFKAAVNESLLFSSIAAFVIAGISSILISRQITKPLRSITGASQEIAKGNFSQRVQVNADNEDELAQLGHSFNRMAEQLEQTENMRRQLIGDISHELRTPLTAIKGSMEGLIDGVLTGDETTYQQIYLEADRLQRLVEDLQELSRVEGGAFRLSKKKINIDELLHDALAPLLNTFNAKGIQVSIHSKKNLPSVMADHDRILQVLQNLLGNTLQFTPENGTIEINAKKMGTNVQISVKDNGDGIKADHLPHIFERFYRADRSRSRQNGGGSGIGLTIAQSLVEAHGGKIWADSEGKGHGSTFTFTLPI